MLQVVINKIRFGYSRCREIKVVTKNLEINFFSKVHIFGLRVILSRLLTRSELEDMVWIDLSHNLVCALCFVEEEDLLHLLFHCSISICVRKKVCDWINLDSIQEADLCKTCC